MKRLAYPRHALWCKNEHLFFQKPAAQRSGHQLSPSFGMDGSSCSSRQPELEVSHPHTCTPIFTCPHTHTSTFTHSHTHISTFTHSHTHTHILTHTHTLTYSHPHTHTSTYNILYLSLDCKHVSSVVLFIYFYHAACIQVPMRICI